MNRVAMLGLGEMGLRMSQNFLNAGFELTVWNRTPSRAKPLIAQGAQQASTPKNAAANADAVISMLTNDEASRAVWLENETGAIHGLSENSIAIECSTISHPWCLELATEITQSSARFLDAPVMGSLPQAEAQQLIHLVGGGRQTLEQVRPVLAVNSSAIHPIGQHGTGMLTKLAVNGLFGVQVAALGEILSVMEQKGIPTKAAVTFLNELPTTSPALKGIGLLMAAKNHAPLFPIKLVEKDFGYIEALNQPHRSELSSISTTRKIYQHAIDETHGELNISAVIEMYQ